MTTKLTTLRQLAGAVLIMLVSVTCVQATPVSLPQLGGNTASEAPKVSPTVRPAVQPTASPAPAPAPAAPPRGRRVTRSSALGPTGYRVGGRRPGADLRGAAPVRMTAYLAPDQVLRLRHEVLRRQRKGERADLSALMREAIEHTFPPSRR